MLSYAILAEYFPKELAGRANGALNVFHIGGAFVLQYVTGLVLQRWTPQAGHYPEIAYQAAFTLNLVFQIAAWVWFALPRAFLQKTNNSPTLGPRWPKLLNAVWFWSLKSDVWYPEVLEQDAEQTIKWPRERGMKSVAPAAAIDIEIQDDLRGR